MPSPSDLLGYLPDSVKDGLMKKYGWKVLGGVGATGLAALAGWGISSSGSKAPSKPNMTRKANRWDESGDPYEGAETAADYIGDTFTRGVPKLVGGLEDAWDNGPQRWMDWADWQTGGLAKPLIYSGLTGAAGYGVGRLIGNSDYLKEKFFKNKSWAEQQGEAPREFNIEGQSEEFSKYMANLRKTKEGQKQAQNIYEAMQELALDRKFNPATINTTPVNELARKFPGLFGASGFAGRKKAPLIEQNFKEGDLRRELEKTNIPLQANPALEYLQSTGKWKVRDVDQVFADYHRDIASPYLRALHQRAFGGGISAYDDKGNPVFDDGPIGTEDKKINPYELYQKHLNQFYKKSLGLDKPSVQDRNATGAFGTFLDTMAGGTPQNYDDIRMPRAHPYQHQISGNNVRANRLLPNEHMSPKELRDFLGRKYGLFGGETPDMIDMIAGNRMMGGRKMGAGGTRKDYAYNSAMFPWAKQLLTGTDWGKQVMAKNDSLNRKWDATIGDMASIQVPKYVKAGDPWVDNTGWKEAKDMNNPKMQGYANLKQLNEAKQAGNYKNTGNIYWPFQGNRPDWKKTLGVPPGTNPEEWNESWLGGGYPWGGASMVSDSGRNRTVTDAYNQDTLAYRALDKQDWMNRYGEFSKALSAPTRTMARLQRRLPSGTNLQVPQSMADKGATQAGFDLFRKNMNNLHHTSAFGPTYKPMAEWIRDQNNLMSDAFGLLYGNENRGR